MTKLDFHRFQVCHFSNNLEQSPCYCKMGQRQLQRADLSVFGRIKIHHQAKYQRLNANTLYVAAILFFRSTLLRESLPCLPNNNARASLLVVHVIPVCCCNSLNQLDSASFRIDAVWKPSRRSVP